MSLTDFIRKYTNRKIDFDGVFGYQCVDLFRQYCEEVLEIEHTGSVNSAKELFVNYEHYPKLKTHFERLTNDFEVGDIIIWNYSSNNSYGHVAIIIEVIDDFNIKVIEQDGFKQDGVKMKIYNPRYALGVLRFKKNMG